MESEKKAVKTIKCDKVTLENFTCPICQDLIQDLHECSQCRNAFCKSCIDKWQVVAATQLKSQCPLRCLNAQFIPASKLLRTELDRLVQI